MSSKQFDPNKLTKEAEAILSPAGNEPGDGNDHLRRRAEEIESRSKHVLLVKVSYDSSEAEEPEFKIIERMKTAARKAIQEDGISTRGDGVNHTVIMGNLVSRTVFFKDRNIDLKNRIPASRNSEDSDAQG